MPAPRKIPLCWNGSCRHSIESMTYLRRSLGSLRPRRLSRSLSEDWKAPSASYPRSEGRESWTLAAGLQQAGTPRREGSPQCLSLGSAEFLSSWGRILLEWIWATLKGKLSSTIASTSAQPALWTFFPTLPLTVSRIAEYSGLLSLPPNTRPRKTTRGSPGRSRSKFEDY